MRSLTVHSVQCANVTLSITHLFDLLASFPNLSRLAVPSIGVAIGPDYVLLNMPTFGTPLAANVREVVHPRDLSVGANLRVLGVSTVAEYETLLKHLPEHVEVTYHDYTDRPWPVALMQQSVRFAVVKHDYGPWYVSGGKSNDPANDFLVANYLLRLFDSIEHSILVDEMLRRPWACMWLEWLSVRILGVECLTVEEQNMVDRVMAAGYTDELFTGISELATLVSSFLTTPDLFACVQVSSQWHNLFISALWHTIDDTTLSWSHILYQCGDPEIRKCYPYLSEKLTDADKN
ncbi:hypothetical protein BGZ82_002672 [Podila clonocystis]|nr:hypothetical protein BGZ82_002672 [Podila clonocystis]